MEPVCSPHHRVRLRVVEGAVVEHLLRSAGAVRTPFFSGLEDDEHRAVDFVSDVAQQLHRGKPHRRVRVVAAGVHAAVLGGEGKPRLLLDRKTVDIRSDGEDLVLVLSLDERRDAVFPEAPAVGDPHLVQLGADVRLRLRGVHTCLGNLVQIPPPRRYLLLKLLRGCAKVRHINPSFLKYTRRARSKAIRTPSVTFSLCVRCRTDTLHEAKNIIGDVLQENNVLGRQKVSFILFLWNRMWKFRARGSSGRGPCGGGPPRNPD